MKPVEVGGDLLVIEGKTKEDVKATKELANSWSAIYSRLSPMAGYRKLSPFNTSCLGVQSSGGFKVTSKTHGKYDETLYILACVPKVAVALHWNGKISICDMIKQNESELANNDF